MNVKEAVELVVTKDSPKVHADVDAFMSVFQMHEVGWSERFDERVHQRYIEEWLCTDRMVGLAVVFFDDKPLAISEKRARKSDTEILFLPGTEELRKEFAAFLVTLHEDTDDPYIQHIGWDQEIVPHGKQPHDVSYFSIY